MEEREIAIKIEGLKKRYRLGQIGGGTLKGDLQSWWARVRKKEDPNLKIGSKAHHKNETFMALDGVDLTVYKGERVGIIGHNGAGKSTLLKLLSRVTGPTEGIIKIKGRISSMLEVGTGFNTELTGRENIYLNGAFLGMSKAEVDAKIEDIIDFSECRQFIDTPVKRYSSGMYVKLAFSVAAHLDSEILIMDEVLAVGDMNFQQKCLAKMRQVAETEDRTILYVSHNMNTIRELCDRCIVLSHGKKIFDGEVEPAINMYIDVVKSGVANDVDLSSAKRGVGIIGDARFTRVEVRNKDAMIFEQGEKAEFYFTVSSDVDMEKANVRIIVKTAANATIGTAFSQELKDLKKGKNVYKLVFDTSFLPGNNYKVILDLYSLSDGYRQQWHDIVLDAFYFDVIRSRSDNGPKWDFWGWGSVKFPDVSVTKEID